MQQTQYQTNGASQMFTAELYKRTPPTMGIPFVANWGYVAEHNLEARKPRCGRQAAIQIKQERMEFHSPERSLETQKHLCERPTAIQMPQEESSCQNTAWKRNASLRATRNKSNDSRESNNSSARTQRGDANLSAGDKQHL